MKPIVIIAILVAALSTHAQTPATQRFDSLTAAYQGAGYHGVVLVAKGDSVLYQKGYGYANFTQKIPHTPATLFKTESVGKMLTATAILQFVEQNKLKLSQTVKELLPELSLKNADKITIDHLLKHTSGMQSPWDHPQWSFKKDFTRQEMEKIVTEVPLQFATPGKEMWYSNSGYLVLGWIIEKVSGKPFDQYLQDAFFIPLGMTATGHLNDTAMPVKNGAQPYRIINSKRFIDMSETVGPTASAAGGWISTAADWHRFAAALNSSRVLQPNTLQMMRTANGAAPTDASYRYYAYGLETYKNNLLPGRSLFGHNGGGAGFSVDVFTEPESGYIVVSCTNLYQNSRPIMVNYFKAALGLPLQSVDKSIAIKLYDLIDSIGMTAFAQSDSIYFKQLSVNPHPGVFAELGEAMAQAGDHQLSQQWMALGRKRYPEEGMLYYISGDLALKGGNNTVGKDLLQQAKALGEKHKDLRVVGAATERLKGVL